MILQILFETIRAVVYYHCAVLPRRTRRLRQEALGGCRMPVAIARNRVEEQRRGQLDPARQQSIFSKFIKSQKSKYSKKII